jgi:hypothetical protein
MMCRDMFPDDLIGADEKKSRGKKLQRGSFWVSAKLFGSQRCTMFFRQKAKERRRG